MNETTGRVVACIVIEVIEECGASVCDCQHDSDEVERMHLQFSARE